MADTTTRRALAILGWTIALCLLISWTSERLGLKYVQGVVWPVDLYAFQHKPTAPIDVAILGSSRASFGLAPDIIDACLAEKLGRPTRTVNLARAFANAYAWEALADDLLEPPRRPRLLLVESGLESFDANDDKLGDNVAVHGELTDLPAVLAATGRPQDLVDALWPLVRGLENLSLFLTRRHETERYLRWMMLYHDGGQFCFDAPACRAPAETLASGRLKSMMTPAEDGSVAIPGETARLLRQHRYLRHRIGGIQHERFARLVTWANDNQVQLALMQLPVHQSFVDIVPESVWAATNANLRHLAETYDLPYLDARTPEWSRRSLDFYYGPHHLNATGAALLSREVCAGLLVDQLR